jgi:hypothetical protein
MLIYQFIRRVQDEHDLAKRETTRLDGMQCHGKAHTQRIRASVLREVLGWAGFEDCEVLHKDALEKLRRDKKIDLTPGGGA